MVIHSETETLYVGSVVNNYIPHDVYIYNLRTTLKAYGVLS